MRPCRILVVAGLLSVPFTPVLAAAQTSEDIVRRYVEALGGADALHAVHAMTYLRTVQNTEAGITTVQSHTRFLTRRPAFYRSERSETGSFYITDGVNAWSGRRDSDGEAIEWSAPRFLVAARDIDFDRPFGPFIDYDQKGREARYVGETQLDEVTLQAVRVLWKDGVEWEYYFDSSTGLCYGWDASPGQPGGLIRVDDYRRVGGILIAHRNTAVDTLANGAIRVHERLFSDFDINPDLPEALFRPGRDAGNVGG